MSVVMQVLCKNPSFSVPQGSHYSLMRSALGTHCTFPQVIHISGGRIPSLDDKLKQESKESSANFRHHIIGEDFLTITEGTAVNGVLVQD